MSVIALNPCISCGACCAFYRVSFYWTEAALDAGGTVPPELTEQLTPFLVVMKGTTNITPRCTCLLGDIGEQVQCSIYPQRASVCREFRYSGQDGKIDEYCDKARAAWGLPPLFSPSPVEPDRPITPKAA